MQWDLEALRGLQRGRGLKVLEKGKRAGSPRNVDELYPFTHSFGLFSNPLLSLGEPQTLVLKNPSPHSVLEPNVLNALRTLLHLTLLTSYAV